MSLAGQRASPEERGPFCTQGNPGDTPQASAPCTPPPPRGGLLPTVRSRPPFWTSRVWTVSLGLGTGRTRPAAHVSRMSPGTAS